MIKEPTAKLTHDEVRKLPQGDTAKEFTCPVCGHGHLQLFQTDGVVCRNGCAYADIRKSIRSGNVRPQADSKPKKLKPSEEDGFTGFTLADYCELKQLSAFALNTFFGDGKSTLQATHNGKPAVAFPYMDAKGRVLATKVRKSANSHDTYFRPAAPHVPYGLWLYTNRVNGNGQWPQDVVICEGESDVQTLTAHGISALGISGSNGWRTEFAELDVLKNAERIFIVKEPDDAGPKFVERIAKDLPPEKTFALELAAKDPSDLHLDVLVRRQFDSGATFEEEFNVAVLKASPARAFAINDQWEVQTLRADAIEPKIYRWLWEDRIPLNTFTLFVGLPDQGKSTVAIDVVARVTTGTKFPDKEHDVLPSSVLMMIAEDELDDTVVPRLMAAKADRSRVHFAQITTLTGSTTKKERRLTLDKDLAAIERKLAQMPDIKLLVIDPISSYVGDLNSNRSGEIRPLLEGLKDMAHRASLTVIGIAHFNKNADQESIHRVAGAGAWGEVPRCIWGFVPKPEEGDGPQNEEPSSLMLAAKLNTASKIGRQGLTYRIVGAEIPTKEGPARTSRIEWLGGTVETFRSVMEAGKSSRGPKAVALPAAVNWLRTYLGDGEKWSSEVKEASRAAHISWDTLGEAKKSLKVISARDRGTGRWLMRLPSNQEDFAAGDGDYGD